MGYDHPIGLVKEPTGISIGIDCPTSIALILLGVLAPALTNTIQLHNCVYAFICVLAYLPRGTYHVITAMMMMMMTTSHLHAHVVSTIGLMKEPTDIGIRIDCHTGIHTQ